MKGAYAPVLATLAYVFTPDRSRVLMVHRTGRAGDAHAGKFNGLGGKLEPGEDVVAGIRNTSPIADLKTVEGLEEAGRQLEEVFVTLENHFRDMCDIEFTIEQGKLWMLQTRVGKRTATAALKIAIEMVAEGLITREEAVRRIDPGQLDQLLHPDTIQAANFLPSTPTGLGLQLVSGSCRTIRFSR